MTNKMNKKGLSMPQFIIGAMIFSSIIALVFLMVQSQANDYGATNLIDPIFKANYDKLNNLTGIASTASDITQKDLTVLGVFNLVFKAMFQIIPLIFTSLKVVASQLISFPSYFGVDYRPAQILISLILSTLVVIIVFKVINSLSRQDL